MGKCFISFPQWKNALLLSHGVNHKKVEINIFYFILPYQKIIKYDKSNTEFDKNEIDNVETNEIYFHKY